MDNTKGKGFNKKRVIVPILGGIGNQLFQVSALAGLEIEAELLVDNSLFGVQSNKFGSDLSCLAISEDIKFENFQRLTWLSRKFAGAILRFSRWENSSGISRTVLNLLVRVAEFLLTFRYHGRTRVLITSETGYQRIVTPTDSRNILLLGYFQSYKFHPPVERLRNEFSLSARFVSDGLVQLLNRSDYSRPLVVHVRRGDYALNPQLGMLSRGYYLKHIERIFESSSCDSIWFFSNDSSNAHEFIPQKLHGVTRFMLDVELSDLETLELMKHGYAYLIANSTFSWWAAYLSEAKSENIYIPSPWYAGAPVPNEMSPEAWNRLPSSFEVKKSKNY